MSHTDGAVTQGLLDIRWEFEQTGIVGDGGAILANSLGKLLVGQVTFIEESLIGNPDLDGIQVTALDILHQGHLQHALVISRSHIGRYLCQSGELGCPKTALATDQLIVIRGRWHEQ